MLLGSLPTSDLSANDLMAEYGAAVENLVLARIAALKSRGDDKDRAYNEMCACQRDEAVLREELMRRMGGDSAAMARAA